jgi:hypothetical protein
MGDVRQLIAGQPLAGEYRRIFWDEATADDVIDVYPIGEDGVLPDPPWWALVRHNESFVIIYASSAGTLYRSRVYGSERQVKQVWGSLPFTVGG